MDGDATAFISVVFKTQKVCRAFSLDYYSNFFVMLLVKRAYKQTLYSQKNTRDILIATEKNTPWPRQQNSIPSIYPHVMWRPLGLFRLSSSRACKKLALGYFARMSYDSNNFSDRSTRF